MRNGGARGAAWSVASAVQLPGTGVLPPRGWWEYALVGLALGVVLVAFGWFILGFFRPGEHDPDHIKYSILDDGEGRSRNDGYSHQA